MAKQPPQPQPEKELSVHATPRERFQRLSNNASLHRDMVDAPAFDRGADAAMTQFVLLHTDGMTDPNEAMRVGYMLKGAQEFLRIFKTLGEIQAPPIKHANPDNLQPSDQPRRI